MPLKTSRTTKTLSQKPGHQTQSVRRLETSKRRCSRPLYSSQTTDEPIHRGADPHPPGPAPHKRTNPKRCRRYAPGQMTRTETLDHTQRRARLPQDPTVCLTRPAHPPTRQPVPTPQQSPARHSAHNPTRRRTRTTGTTPARTLVNVPPSSNHPDAHSAPAAAPCPPAPRTQGPRTPAGEQAP